MTRAQMEAARERVGRVLVDECNVAPYMLDTTHREALAGKLVTAVLGHPDGKAPRQPAGAGRKARRFAR